ncbi:MAG: peptide-methionine (S)-S-oxide reductase MsrA [Flavobacteriaceae bacterium]|nr:peptide-methionine (S)-S-oxide reductase MsrA [Flavobacteriaceae bacterium]
MNNNYKQVVLAGGCFWCTEAVFQRLEGVEEVVSGYTGGTIKNPAYREICTGRTGHAEGILISYDPSVIGFETLLEIFFATHDPTTLNRQGNDRGTQYRSAIFFTEEAQRKMANEFIDLLEKNKIFQDPIVTEVTPLGPFYEAGEDHQEFYNSNTEQPYCQYIIEPKIEKINQFYRKHLKTTK